MQMLNRKLLIWLSFVSLSMASGASKHLLRVDFEVFGRVQGVFFRKHTQSQAEALGLKGHVRNTISGTVSGRLEGPKSQVEQMKSWLSKIGSPSSRIDRAEFTNEVEISDYSCKNFGIQKTIKV